LQPLILRLRKPSVLLALAVMVLMWSSHRRSLLMVTPRYLLESTSWSMCPWMVYWALIGFRLLETRINIFLGGRPSAIYSPILPVSWGRSAAPFSDHSVSKAIVNAASDITYRPLIEADDTGRCTLIIWLIFGTRIISFTWSSFSNKTVTISLDRQQKNVLNVISFGFFSTLLLYKEDTVLLKQKKRPVLDIAFCFPAWVIRWRPRCVVCIHIL
jgi:hypothetical protein